MQTDSVTAREAAAVMGELALDLSRAVEGGVLAALRAHAPELSHARAARLAELVRGEIGERFRVGYAASRIVREARRRS